MSARMNCANCGHNRGRHKTKGAKTLCIARQCNCRQFTTYAQEVGKLLRTARARRGYSLTAAEDATGITGSSIGAYERGDRAMRVEYLARIAEAYGVATADLLPDSRVRQGIDAGVAAWT